MNTNCAAKKRHICKAVYEVTVMKKTNNKKTTTVEHKLCSKQKILELTLA